jgi:hypothetical protein
MLPDWNATVLKITWGLQTPARPVLSEKRSLRGLERHSRNNIGTSSNVPFKVALWKRGLGATLVLATKFARTYSCDTIKMGSGQIALRFVSS